MPAFCINPIDNLDAELLHKLNQQNQDVRLFISDKVSKEIVETFLGKKAIGDINDDSHISTASSGAYCGIFLEYDDPNQRETFLEAIRNSSLQRKIWVSSEKPSEEITSIPNLIYIFHKDKLSTHEIILDYEGRDEVANEVINLVD